MPDNYQENAAQSKNVVNLNHNIFICLFFNYVQIDNFAL